MNFEWDIRSISDSMLVPYCEGIELIWTDMMAGSAVFLLVGLLTLQQGLSLSQSHNHGPKTWTGFFLEF